MNSGSYQQFGLLAENIRLVKFLMILNQLQHEELSFKAALTESITSASMHNYGNKNYRVYILAINTQFCGNFIYLHLIYIHTLPFCYCNYKKSQIKDLRLLYFVKIVLCFCL